MIFKLTRELGMLQFAKSAFSVALVLLFPAPDVSILLNSSFTLPHLRLYDFFAPHPIDSTGKRLDSARA